MQAVRSRVAATRTAYRSANVAKWQPKDNVLHVHQGDIVENPEMNCPGNPPAKGWTVVAAVAAILKPSDTDTTPIDTYKNRAWAVIVQAVTDADLWHQWNGLAVNSTIGPIEDYTAEDGSGSGVFVRISIHFRTDENNPYNVRA
jgi:hypothetical protein